MTPFVSRWEGWAPATATPQPMPESPAPASCVACGAEVGPEAIWCPPCWQARQGRVATFDPGRRARAVARESARPCSTCGGTVLRFTPRGDSSCIGCFPTPGAKP